MVSTCANPACKAKFTYLGTGELLLKANRLTGHQELFRLCQDCAIEWQIPKELIPLEMPRLRSSKKAAAA